MEAFGILGFTFGIVSLARVITLEKKIKEFGMLKEKISNNKKEQPYDSDLFTNLGQSYNSKVGGWNPSPAINKKIRISIRSSYE